MSAFLDVQPYKKLGTLKCPDCAVHMVPFQCGPVIIEKCYSCQGIWFEKKEIGIFRSTLGQYDLSKLEIDYPGNLLASYHVNVCPTCQDVLSEEHYSYNSKVNIQKCSHCQGVWVPFSQVVELIRMSKIGQAIASDVRGFTRELKRLEQERMRYREMRQIALRMTGGFSMRNFWRVCKDITRIAKAGFLWLAIVVLQILKGFLR